MLGRNSGNPDPAGGHIGFSPIVPRTGESLLEFKRFYRENLPKVSGGENLDIAGPVYMTCKDAVDPNGILSAGRYGVWPKHLRKV